MKSQLFLSFYALVFVALFSCNNDKSGNQSTGSLACVLGDSLLKTENFAELTNKTCVSKYDFFSLGQEESKEYEKACLWCQMTFEYWKISKRKKTVELFHSDNDKLYIKNFPSPVSNPYSCYYSYLFLESKGKKKDSILIYKNDNFGLSMQAPCTFYYIENESLILVEVGDSEFGTWVKKYSTYKINLRRGRFTRLTEKKFKRKVSEPKREQEFSIGQQYHGTFSADMETDATTTGMSSITYTFSLHADGVELDINTYHNPIQCAGKYIAVETDSTLNLYYNGRESGCDTKEPKFFLKQENGEMYAKGLGGEGTCREWIKLERQ